MIISGPQTIYLIYELSSRTYGECVLYAHVHTSALYGMYLSCSAFPEKLSQWFKEAIRGTDGQSLVYTQCMRVKETLMRGERELWHSHFNLSGNRLSPRVAVTPGWCHHYLGLFTSISFNNPFLYKTPGQLILTNCNGWRGAENAISKPNEF